MPDNVFKSKTFLLYAIGASIFMMAGSAAQASPVKSLSIADYIRTMPHNENIVRIKAAASAHSFIDDMGKDAVGFLGDDSLSEAQKKQEFESLLEAHFDLDTISRFAMGKYWRQMDDRQKQEYRSLFKDMVVSIYSRRFSEYDNQKFVVDGSQAKNEKDTIVNSRIVPDDGPEIKINWHVREKSGDMRIVDVKVEGISLAISKRSEFSSIIAREGGQISALLDALRKGTLEKQEG